MVTRVNNYKGDQLRRDAVTNYATRGNTYAIHSEKINTTQTNCNKTESDLVPFKFYLNLKYQLGSKPLIDAQRGKL